MFGLFSKGFKLCLCREVAGQHKYLFVVMLPSIDLLATYFSGTAAEGSCSIIKHSLPEWRLTIATTHTSPR